MKHYQENIEDILQTCSEFCRQYDQDDTNDNNIKQEKVSLTLPPLSVLHHYPSNDKISKYRFKGKDIKNALHTATPAVTRIILHSEESPLKNDISSKKFLSKVSSFNDEFSTINSIDENSDEDNDNEDNVDDTIDENDEDDSNDNKLSTNKSNSISSNTPSITEDFTEDEDSSDEDYYETRGKSYRTRSQKSNRGGTNTSQNVSRNINGRFSPKSGSGPGARRAKRPRYGMYYFAILLIIICI